MVVLTVRRVRSERGTLRHSYELRAPNETFVGPLQQELTADIDEAVVRDLCAYIETVAEQSAEPGGARADAIDKLSKLGGLLHAALFPTLDGSRIPELVARLHGVDGPLLVSTDEPQVPWELLHDGEQFLGLRHDLGRQLVIDGHTMIRQPSPVPAIARVLLVADPLGDLPMARGEAERVGSWLEEQGAECTVLVGDKAGRVPVLLELASGEYQLFHYAGHIMTPPRSRDAQPADLAALVLHDRAGLTSKAIRDALATPGSPPLVFINGCASGEPLSSLCTAFMKTGAAVVLGTLHRISEEAAAGFAQSLYRNLLAGVPAGRAVREARLDLHRMEDPGWMSFVFHGDPEARIEVGGAASAPAPPRQREPEDELIPGLLAQPDRGARTLLERVVRRAARRGIVTSLDLLAELLAPGGPMRLVAEQRKVAGTADAERVLGVLLALSDRTEPDDQVSLSDTVVRILMQAAERAVRDGRAKLTAVDLADAFVELGGGTSARVLESCGVALEDLRPVDDRGGGGRPTSTVAGNERLGEQLDPAALLALRVATLLRTGEGTVVSSAGLLRGFGLAGSPVLRACLEEQGQPGREAAKWLFPVALGPGGGPFSRRVRLALERAARAERLAGASGVREAAVLEALLNDDESTACQLMERLGVDVARLRGALRRSRVTGDRPDADA